jgi:trans-2-enoyl-CoA reductase
LKVHDPPADALVKWRESAGLAVQDLIGPVFSKEIYDQILEYIREYRKTRGL